jgi:hypothetical protein
MEPHSSHALTRRPTVLAALGVAVAAFLVYLPGLGGGFVYDSVVQIELDDYVHQPSNWRDVLTLRVLGRDEIDRNRPVQLASLMADSMVWERRPFGYRLTSALLHAATAALVVVVAVRLGARRDRTALVCAAAGALFFAFHPLQVEAVVEPSNREDVLAAFFTLLALAVFLSTPAGVSGRALRGFVTVTCCVLAAGSKEIGWMSPFVLAAAWWWVVRPRRQTGTEDLVILVLATLGAGALAVAILLNQPATSEVFLHAPQAVPWSVWVHMQPAIMAGQVERLVFPWRLSPDYEPHNFRPWVGSWWKWLPVAAAAMAAGAAWRFPAGRVGVVLFFASLLPSANLATQFMPAADRFLYLPLAGAVLAGVPWLDACARRPWMRARAHLALATAALVLVLCAARTLHYQRGWHSAEALWATTLRTNPTSWNGLLGSGAVRFEAGDASAAAPFWSEMLRRQPDSAFAQTLVALIADAQGREAEAVALFTEAVAREPTLADPERFLRYYGWRPRTRAALESLRQRAEN